MQRRGYAWAGRKASMWLKASIALSLIVAGALVSSSPANASLLLGNHSKASIGAAARTIYGPTTQYNESELNIGCPSNYKVEVSATWRVSNVTSSSAYVDFLTVNWTIHQSIRLGATALVSGSRSLWDGNWLEPEVTKSEGKTYYFRRTVPWSSGQFFVYQSFGFNGPGTVEPLCTKDLTYYIYLDRA